MATRQATADLARIIATLKAVRQEHLDAIAEIDETFGQFGISAEDSRRRGRRKKAKNGRRKKAAKRKVAKNGRRKKTAAKKAAKKKAGRRKFSKTAEQFVLDLLESGKTMTTAQINSKWKQTQRSGNADNTLSLLAKDGKVKREKIEGAQGSQYSAG